tara:strand:+ start:11934 stop:12719 length:786 start_codon:yes stop_codon:yes gene_type:complete
MPDKPPTKKPDPIYRKRWICGSLALICFILAAIVFGLSTRKFLTWYQTTSPLHRTNDLAIHTTLYIASCAPMCVYLGILGAFFYYRRKRNKHGKYEATMRRRGRGYWIDPSDAEDKKKVDLAKKLNAEPRVKPTHTATTSAPHKSIFNPSGWALGNAQDEKIHSLTAGTSAAKRLTNLNPFGWGNNNEHWPRTAHVPVNNRGDNDIELGNVPREPERALSRSDSIRSSKDDPIVEKGVANIWLSAVRGSANSYGSRHARNG